MSVVAPIHIQAVGLANVRFFAPPSGGREFPWVALDDIFDCVNSARELRRQFKSDLRRGPWANSMRMVAVERGIANIVPHFVAQGLIDGMREVGSVPGGLYVEYIKAGAKALSKITDDLSPPDMMAYIGAAMMASGGAG